MPGSVVRVPEIAEVAVLFTNLEEGLVADEAYDSRAIRVLGSIVIVDIEVRHADDVAEKRCIFYVEGSSQGLYIEFGTNRVLDDDDDVFWVGPGDNWTASATNFGPGVVA